MCRPSVRRILPLLVALSGVPAACTDDTPAAAPRPVADAAAPVVLAAAERREFAAVIEGLGTARALESVLVTARVGGRVEEIFFKDGATARAGQPLVRLEDDEERAELAVTQAAAEQADSRLRRMQELSARGLVPRDQVEEQAQLARSAASRLELARVRLEQRTVRAPFAGQLGFRQVSPGALVQPGTPIVSLDAVETLQVEFSVPETQLAGLAVGARVQARAAAHPGRVFEGAVRAVDSRVDEVTRAVLVRARVGNADRALKPGMLLTVGAQAPPRAAVFVPEAAVAPEQSAQFVWRVTPQNTAEKVAVALGARLPGWVEIANGVAAGERVVVEGQANLRPGRPVRDVTPAG